jgi:hypothetical protein
MNKYILSGLVGIGAMLLIVWTAVLCADSDATTQKAATTDWVGHPMLSDNAPTPMQGWLSYVQIGLRSDGVVVWTATERKSNGYDRLAAHIIEWNKAGCPKPAYSSCTNLMTLAD